MCPSSSSAGVETACSGHNVRRLLVCVQVRQHMTTPALTVGVSATVQEAAELMLKKKIRRLPVVDDQGFPVG